MVGFGGIEVSRAGEIVGVKVAIAHLLLTSQSFHVSKSERSA